jgi:hypothetical protein
VEQRGSHRDDGLIASEEDGAEGGGLVIWIGLELRIGVEYEDGADSREQTRLQGQVR